MPRPFRPRPMLRLCLPAILAHVALAACAQDFAFTEAHCALPPPVLLTEADAVARLRGCNRDLIAARRAVAAAAADRKVAGEPPNPVLTAGAGAYNPSLGAGSGSLAGKTVDSSVRIEQLFERGDKLGLRKQNTELLLGAAQQDLADAERQQATVVLQAMVDLAAATERVGLLEEVRALYAETARANERRLARGDMARIDVQRQSLDAARNEVDLTQARADVRRARLALAVALAWDEHVDAIAPDSAILTAAAPAGMPDPSQRPDVRAARARLEAATAARDLALAQKKADVTIGVQYDHYPQSASNPNGTGNTWGVTFSVPLLVRHRFEGEIARATNDYFAAQEALGRAIASARTDWLRLDQDREAAQTRLRLLESSQAPTTEQVLRAAEVGYAKGALTVLDVLDARRAARQVHLDIVSARAELARAAAAQRAWIAAAEQ